MKDALGHEHKPPGEGGGQFTGHGSDVGLVSKNGTLRKEADEKLKHTNEWNAKLGQVAKTTGRDEWDVVDEMLGNDRVSDGGHNVQMAHMDKMIAEHGNKRKAWEPDDSLAPQHFETGDWEKPEAAAARKSWWEKRWQVRQKIRDELVEADLPRDTKGKYLKTAQEVLTWMPAAALDHFLSNVEKIDFHKNTHDLTKNVESRTFRKEHGTVGGCWVHGRDNNTGTLMLDGDTFGLESRGIYAHEFGHVCDWIPGSEEMEDVWRLNVPIPEATARVSERLRGLGFNERRLQMELKNLDIFSKENLDAMGIKTDDLFKSVGTRPVGHAGRNISSTNEWRDAFDAELSKGQLSKYGATVRHEGFAEFARLVWGGGGERPRDIKEQYPKCWAVLESHGLVVPIPERAVKP